MPTSVGSAAFLLALVLAICSVPVVAIPIAALAFIWEVALFVRAGLADV